MGYSSWPGPGPATVSEHQHEQLWEASYATGLHGPHGQSSFVFGDNSGLQVKLRPSRTARVRGQVFATDGSGVTLPISSNGSGATRIDLVVLRLDRSTWEVDPAVVEGTPGAGTPSIQLGEGDSGAYDLLVGEITIPNGASSITSGMVNSRDAVLGAPLIVGSDSDVPSQNLQQPFLRYRPDQDAVIFHRTGGGASETGIELYRDSGEVILADSTSRWEATSPTSYVRKIGHMVELRYAAHRRLVNDLSPNTESNLPGVIPTSMRHPTRDHSYIVRTTGGDAGRVTIIRDNASSNAGRIRLVTHTGIDEGQFVSSFTALWLVP